MVEDLPSCSQEMLQPRMEWNLVLKLAKNISKETCNAGIDPHQVVFVGGFATFLHTKQALGDRVVNFWRGTDDVDMVITSRGGTGKILAGLQKSGQYQYVDSAPSHFVDKQTWSLLKNPQGFLPEEARTTDVDVYFLNKNSGNVRFNERTISPYPGKFITEPVELVGLMDGTNESKIAIPTITDLLLMKLDIINLSKNKKLRDKDTNDVLSLLMVAERKGLDGSDLIKNILLHINGKKEKKRVVDELTGVYTNLIQCYRYGNIPVDRKIFLPTIDYIKRSRDGLNSENIGILK